MLVGAVTKGTGMTSTSWPGTAMLQSFEVWKTITKTRDCNARGDQEDGVVSRRWLSRVAVNRCRNLSKDPLVLVHRPEDQNPHETDPSNTEKVEERRNDRVQRGRGNNPHEV